ncbi:MAG TPA: MaoC family dehydratase [Alphaproteobacteria bacterium]|nr:MaoC family dehydratase [Alphaproteobacteria bacterium]
MTKKTIPTGFTLEQLSLGQAAEAKHEVSDETIRRFAEVSGDNNPIHLDADYAATTRFGKRIAHGMLAASYISAMIGTTLPGPGAIYMGQTLKFRAPVRIGDSVTVRVEVTALNAEKKRVTLATVCRVGDTVVVEGEALIMVPSGA